MESRAQRRRNLIAIGALMPLFGFWCLGQIWGQRRAWMWLGLLLGGVAMVVMTWTAVRILAGGSAQLRDNYVRIVMFGLRRKESALDRPTQRILVD